MKGIGFFMAMVFTIFLHDIKAQEGYREIGLRLTDFNSLNFIYKKQLYENIYKRYRVVAGNFLIRIKDEFLLNTNLGLAIGKEKRKDIAERLQFVHGWEPAVFAGFSKNDTDFVLSGNINLGYVLGFQYNASEKFVVSLEAIPYFGVYASYTDSGLNPVAVQGGISNNVAAITVVYRFFR